MDVKIVTKAFTMRRVGKYILSAVAQPTLSSRDHYKTAASLGPLCAVFSKMQRLTHNIARLKIHAQTLPPLKSTIYFSLSVSRLALLSDLFECATLSKPLDELCLNKSWGEGGGAELDATADDVI